MLEFLHRHTGQRPLQVAININAANMAPSHAYPSVYFSCLCAAVLLQSVLCRSTMLDCQLLQSNKEADTLQ